ncbi:MAG: hypothetical protein ACRD1H_18080, partial [Vicinamibacterales bacterium]
VGEVALPGDAGAVADAILRVLDPDRGRAIRANLAGLAPRYTWEIVAAPLLTYCRDPWRLAPRRDTDAAAGYVHRIERMYSETAEYARHLERAVAERDRVVARNRAAALHPAKWVRTRPNLGTLFRRGKRG